MMGFLDSFKRWKSRLHPENRNVTWAVCIEKSGFTLARRSDGGEERTHSKWAEIQTVHAFKRDCFGFDQINLQFEFEDGSATDVSENDEGYKEFLLALPACIPGFPAETEWWEKVAKPPFARNWTCLYRRPDAQRE